MFVDNDEQIIEYYGGFPYHEDKKVNERFQVWDHYDEEASLGSDPRAIRVLSKIITDGHIRAGWAIRNGRPTIYGPSAAACFTEMPLYGLINYATQRSSHDVGLYAIAVPRDEFFVAGGRPAIYGLTGPHREQYTHGKVWPRKLMPSCGLGEEEQYRYVAMAIDDDRSIDWSHEREWR